MFLKRSAIITTMTSREFNQDAGRAKRAAKGGPVFITDRGEPAHVLLTIEEYRKLSCANKNMVEMLACPSSEYISFDPVKVARDTFTTESLP
jgi:prevent-host-death family protein